MTLNQWSARERIAHDRVNDLMRQVRSAAGDVRLMAFSGDRAAKDRAQERVEGLMRELRQAVAQRERIFHETVTDDQVSSDESGLRASR